MIIKIMQLIHYPNSILLSRTNRVTFPCQVNLKELAQHMFDIMHQYQGIGLAANQIGVALSIATIDYNTMQYILVNPEIKEASGSVQDIEGCLSIPGAREPIKRYKELIIKYQDIEGEEHFMQAEGYLARIIQHEVDHLNGKTYIHRLSHLKREIFLKKHY